RGTGEGPPERRRPVPREGARNRQGDGPSLPPRPRVQPAAAGNKGPDRRPTTGRSPASRRGREKERRLPPHLVPPRTDRVSSPEAGRRLPEVVPGRAARLRQPVG